MEYILVLLIVALLNGAIAYIDSLLTDIVPLTLYAEKYMTTLSGTNITEELFNILFGFGVSLIVLKFLKKGFETYVTWTDGDADEEPLSLLTNFFKAMAVAICFPTIYGWLGQIVEEMTNQLLAAIGASTSYNWGHGCRASVRRAGNGNLRTGVYHLLLYSVFPVSYERLGNHDPPHWRPTGLRGLIG
jgi:hypothetical protein